MSGGAPETAFRTPAGRADAHACRTAAPRATARLFTSSSRRPIPRGAARTARPASRMAASSVPSASAASRRERSGPLYLALRIEAEPVTTPFSPVQSDAIAAAELVERRVLRAAIAIEANQRHPSLRTADPHPLLAFLGRRHPDHPPQIALGPGSGASEDERREGEHLVGPQPRRLGELAEEWRRMPAHLGGAPVPRRSERRTWRLREAGSQREPAFAQQRVPERGEGPAGLAQRGLDDCNRALQAPDECQGIG